MSQTPEYMQSIQKESILQSVINRVTDAIKRGELKPGDRMPSEIELAQSLGVARSSVREAIKILAYLGVLESVRSEGTFVCSGYSESMIDPMVYGVLLNQDSYENLMELREMTETGMIRIAIDHYDEAEIGDLEAIISEMEDAVLAGDEAEERFFEADDRFHDKIAEMGRNPMADKINRLVRSLTYNVRKEKVAEMIQSGRGRELIDAHLVLLGVIREKDTHGLSEKVRSSYLEKSCETNN